MRPTADCYAIADALLSGDRELVARAVSQVIDTARMCIDVRADHAARVAALEAELQRRGKPLPPEPDPRQVPMFVGWS